MTDSTSHNESGLGHDLPEQDGPANHVDQLLISYLDGELDERSSAELEARLASDESLRGRLHEFQKTWDMLDELEPTQPGEAFVKSTIEMVVTGNRPRNTKWHRWPLRVAAGLLCLVAPAAAAHSVVRYWQDQPYRDFVSDIDFWENVDMYDQVDSIEFVEMMLAEGWFNEELPSEELPRD